MPVPAGWRELGDGAPGEGSSMCRGPEVAQVSEQKMASVVAAVGTKRNGAREAG